MQLPSWSAHFGALASQAARLASETAFLTEAEETAGKLLSAGHALQLRHTWRQPQLTRP